MFKRFFVSIAIAIFSCGVIWAEEGHSWYVVDPYQIETFLVGVGGKQLDTKALWENVKAQDVAVEIGQKIDDFFVKFAKDMGGFLEKDLPLRIMFERLGFVPYKHNDKAFNVLLLDKYAFLEEFRDPEKYVVAEVVFSTEKGFSCADFYRSIGSCIASYFKETLERVKIHEKCSFDYPVMHIFVKKQKDGSIKMRVLPRGRQDIYKRHDDAISEIQDAQKEDNLLSKIGKGALFFLGLYGLSEATWKKLPATTKNNVLKCMKGACKKMPTSSMMGACNFIVPTIDEANPVILPDVCKNPENEAIGASCKALQETKKLSDERDDFENRMKVKLQAGSDAIEKLEKEIKEFPKIIEEYKIQMHAKDNNITTYKNQVFKLNEDFKNLNSTFIDCQKGLNKCNQDLESMTDSFNNCTMREQIAMQKINNLSNKLRTSKDGINTLKKGIKSLNTILDEQVPMKNDIACQQNKSLLCRLVKMKDSLQEKTKTLLDNIAELSGAIENFE